MCVNLKFVPKVDGYTFLLLDEADKPVIKAGDRTLYKVNQGGGMRTHH